MQTKVIWVCLFIACILSSCKDESIEPEVILFEICPVDTASISEASPLGNINPPGHTFPSIISAFT